VKHNAAILIKDSEAQERLGAEIIALMHDEERKKNMGENISKFAYPDAAVRIAREIMNLAGKN
jgi:UDP-N-acetylglucosamine--N-acetylmuramyl-(pentapeptide) pyrophosphoryl-undecaprenol N-acetylglucosamine transferase